MQPDTGGRFQALLLSHDASGARFAVELSTNAGVWSSEVSVLQPSGEIEWGAWLSVRAAASFDPSAAALVESPAAADPAPPPAWLCKYLHAGLRAAWRAHAEDGWPRRLTRWRDAPDPRRARDVDESH